MSPHAHRWHMTGIRAGYIVTERCHECGARSSFFTTEAVPPVDEYKEGRHYWIYQGSFQAVKFRLACDSCSTSVDLDDLVALMLSTCDDPKCSVGRLVRGRPEHSVYVALCKGNRHASGQCVSPEAIEALTQYFNQYSADSDRRVTVVPCSECSDLDTCKGIVIADSGLTEIY